MGLIDEVRAYFGSCRSQWRHDWVSETPGHRCCRACGERAVLVADASGWSAGYWEAVRDGATVDKPVVRPEAIKTPDAPARNAIFRP